jgi:hypothetical protein
VWQPGRAVLDASHSRLSAQGAAVCPLCTTARTARAVARQVAPREPIGCRRTIARARDVRQCKGSRSGGRSGRLWTALAPSLSISRRPQHARVPSSVSRHRSPRTADLRATDGGMLTWGAYVAWLRCGFGVARSWGFPTPCVPTDGKCKIPVLFS